MTQGPGRRLVLFRHAKSAWPDVADHDRPLARRGIRDAPVMGRWLLESGYVPDQVMCSTARRARETWRLAQPELAAAPPVTFDRRVYDREAAGLLALIQETPAAVGTLLLIGHNPALQDLAVTLAAAVPGGAASLGPSDVAAGGMERMRAKFPTAAIAVLEPATTWPKLTWGRARLAAFVAPRDLAGRGGRRNPVTPGGGGA